MGLILATEDPLKPTLSEAVLSYGPTVIMFIVFILIVAYCVRAVKNRYVNNKNETSETKSSTSESVDRVVR